MDKFNKVFFSIMVVGIAMMATGFGMLAYSDSIRSKGAELCRIAGGEYLTLSSGKYRCFKVEEIKT